MLTERVLYEKRSLLFVKYPVSRKRIFIILQNISETRTDQTVRNSKGVSSYDLYTSNTYFC